MPNSVLEYVPDYRIGGFTIKTWKLAFALGLSAVGLLVFLMLQLPNNEAGPPPTTASYVDNALCAACHPETNTSQAGTLHASAWFENNNCEPCHSTGAGRPSIYPATGYDITTDTPVYLQNITCQACHGPGSLHVAASFSQKQATIGLVLNSSLCGSCHYSPQGLSSTHHPTYNEWEVSGHNTSQRLPVYVKNPSCSNCHEVWNAIEYLETGAEKTVLREAGEDAPLTWDIACVTCHNPHNATNPYQLRVVPEELCARCHNSQGAQPGSAPHHPMAEMRNNTGGYGIDRADAVWMPSVYCVNCHMGENPRTGLANHTFAPNPWNCVQCHNTTFTSNESARTYIDMIASATKAQVTGAELSVGAAGPLIEQMSGNRTSEDIAAWTTEYEIAQFNVETVVQDNSGGNHNPILATRLLDDAMERAQEIIANLTPPDEITGVQVTRLADGSIVVNWSDSGATDFAKYRIYVLTTAKSNVTSETWKTEITSRATLTATVTGFDKNTSYYVYVTAVDTDGNEITNGVAPVKVGKVAATPEPQQPVEEKGLSTLDYGLIGVVAALAAIAALLGMMLMRKGKGEKTSETPAKTEE